MTLVVNPRCWARRLVSLCLAALGLLGASPFCHGDSPAAVPWNQPRKGAPLSFPADHGAHPGFRTEWWYVTGHLEADRRPLGFQLTFFRRSMQPPRSEAGSGKTTAVTPGLTTTHTVSPWAVPDLYMAHFAVTDPVRGLRLEERLSRPGSGAAAVGHLSVRNGGWFLQKVPDEAGSSSQEGVMLGLEAHAGFGSLRLSLTTTRPPVVHGEGGVHEKSPGAGLVSHYVSLTRLEAVGDFTVGGHRTPVTGLAWFDHEWMSSEMTPDQTGWDWLGLHLSDGSDLMVARVRSRSADHHATSGTWVGPDGRWEPLPFGSISYTPAGEWVSPSSGGKYPVRPQVAIPSKNFVMDVTPIKDDQELNTKASTGVVYWEGLVRVKAQQAGRPVTGTGYLEMTGYAGAAPLSGSER